MVALMPDPNPYGYGDPPGSPGGPVPQPPPTVPPLHPLAQSLFSLPAADLAPTLNRQWDFPALRQTTPPGLSFGQILQPQQNPQTQYDPRVVQETANSPWFMLLQQLLNNQNTGRFSRRLQNPAIQVIAQMLAAKGGQA